MKPLSILVLLLAGAACAAEAGSPEHVNEVIQFNNTFGVFFRDLMGCPAKAADASQCNAKLGIWNQAAWKQLQEQAPRVFPQPPKKKARRRWWLLWTR